MDWRSLLIEDEAGVAELVRSARRVAVLGMKGEDRADQPAHYVPAYLARAGAEVIPVPVFYPDVTEMLGLKVYRSVSDVPGPVDIVDVFRRPQDVPAHVPDIIAKRPGTVWLQSGIRHDGAAELFAREGIRVVQDRCLMVDWKRFR
jgi:predicted CoA-binding protein